MVNIPGERQKSLNVRQVTEFSPLTTENTCMLLSDGVYKRVPLFWMVIGILFLFLGLSAGSGFSLLPAYLALGTLCIARGIWIYQARWRHHRKNQIHILRSTQIIDRKSLSQSRGS
jgi:hypothetical protein